MVQNSLTLRFYVLLKLASFPFMYILIYKKSVKCSTLIYLKRIRCFVVLQCIAAFRFSEVVKRLWSGRGPPDGGASGVNSRGEAGKRGGVIILSLSSYSVPSEYKVPKRIATRG